MELTFYGGVDEIGDIEKESLLGNLGFAYFHAEEYEETIRVFKEFHELIIALFN